MPAPNWNHVFSSRDVTGATHQELFDVFREAVWQREVAVAANLFSGGESSPLVVAGTRMLEGTDLGEGWGGLQWKIHDLAQFFIRRYNADGTKYDPEGLRTLDSPLAHKNDDTTETKLPFPYPNGWERHYPREIYTLSQGGTNGQRARFSARIGTAWFGSARSDPLFNTIVTTPLGERVNSGKLFDRVAGAWVLSADQTTDPDEIIEFMGINNDYLRLKGDYFGHWFLNDLRNAINELVRLPAFTGTSEATWLQEIAAPTNTLTIGSRWKNSTGQLNSKRGFGFTETDVENDYDAAALADNFFDGDWPGIYVYQSNVGSVSYTMKAAQNKIQLYSRFGGAWTNPFNWQANMSYWVWPIEWRESGVPTIDVDHTYEYDDWGTGLVEEEWHEFASDVTDDDFTLESTNLGNIPATHFTPPFPVSDLSKEFNLRGWSGFIAMILLDYEVTGGFDHTLLSPG